MARHVVSAGCVCVCWRLGEVEGACASEKWGRGCGPVGPSFMKALLYRPTLTHYACKSFQMSTTRSKGVGTSSDIFGNVRNSSENSRKSSEVAGTFLKIPVMTRRNSHAF